MIRRWQHLHYSLKILIFSFEPCPQKPPYESSTTVHSLAIFFWVLSIIYCEVRPGHTDRTATRPCYFLWMLNFTVPSIAKDSHMVLLLLFSFKLYKINKVLYTYPEHLSFGLLFSFELCLLYKVELGELERRINLLFSFEFCPSTHTIHPVCADDPRGLLFSFEFC